MRTKPLNTEIERKFLVKSDAFIAASSQHLTLTQGYLCNDDKKVVRVRSNGSKGFITIKTSITDVTRKEYEYEIPLSDAQELLALCNGVIEKVRYLVPYHNHVYEVDVFDGDNKGLVVAEIELHAEDEAFDKPEWLDKEVTSDHRYLNSELMKHPYSTW